MLHELLAVDLGDWHPRYEMPQTDELQKQILLSLPIKFRWLLALLDDGCLPYPEVEAGEENRTTLRNLQEHANQFTGRKKEIDGGELTELLKDWGVARKHTNSGNLWEFPELAGMRARFDTEYGKQEWNPEVSQWSYNGPRPDQSKGEGYGGYGGKARLKTVK